MYTRCQLLTMVSAYPELMYQALVDVYRLSWVSIVMRRGDTSCPLQLSVTYQQSITCQPHMQLCWSNSTAAMLCKRCSLHRPHDSVTGETAHPPYKVAVCPSKLDVHIVVTTGELHTCKSSGS